MKLKPMFYITFLMLIVLPLMLAAGGIALYLRSSMMTSAHTQVDELHASVSTVLRDEVREASLGLAYFLLGNDGEVSALAATAPADSVERFDRAQRMQDIFSYYAFQADNVLAMHLYLKDGTVYDLLAGLAVPLTTVRQTACWKAAEAKPGSVHIGSAPSDMLRYGIRSHGEILLMAAMTVEDSPIPTQLDMACLYFSTDAEDLISQYNQDVGQASRTFLLDGETILAGDSAYAQDALDCLRSGGEALGRFDWYAQTVIPNTSLTILTLVDQGKLMAPLNRTLAICVMILALLLGSYALWSILYLRQILQPLQDLSRGMSRWAEGDFSCRLTPRGHRELKRLLQQYNDTSMRTAGLIRENSEREKEAYREELKALQYEINPHFLLNTVNTIRLMASMAKFTAISDMAASLMEILRTILRNPGERYTLAHEYRLLQAYADIMEVRNAGSFTVSYDLAQDTLDCRIPKLLLQPLVENALQHAFPEADGLGEVRIASRLDGDTLHLTVTDNGAGMDADQLRKCMEPEGDEKSIGLANVRRRIELMCGQQGGMEVCSAPGKGTTVTLTIPAIHLTSQEDA
ncbi:MAG: sensor histidine kinase [Aristaeellaceae bacterium]